MIDWGHGIDKGRQLIKSLLSTKLPLWTPRANPVGRKYRQCTSELSQLRIQGLEYSPTKSQHLD